MNMFCSKCGTQLPDSSRFCPKCGTCVDNSKKSEPAQPFQPLRTSSGFWGTVKRNMNNSKIAILILSGIQLLAMFIMPYFYIVTGKSSKTVYPIHLIGGNDYPSSCPFDSTTDIALTFLLFAFIGAIGCVVYSLLVNKYRFCKSVSVANLVLSCMAFYCFFIPIINSADDNPNMKIGPIGAVIHIGVSIAVLVLVVKLITKEKKAAQSAPVIFR